MAIYEICKLKYGERTIISYDDAIEHIATQLLDYQVAGILRHNSDGSCERTARMSDRWRAANIALEQLFRTGWVQIDEYGYTSDGFADDSFFNLSIKRVR